MHYTSVFRRYPLTLHLSALCAVWGFYNHHGSLPHALEIRSWTFPQIWSLLVYFGLLRNCNVQKLDSSSHWQYLKMSKDHIPDFLRSLGLNPSVASVSSPENEGEYLCCAPAVPLHSVTGAGGGSGLQGCRMQFSCKILLVLVLVLNNNTYLF